MIQLVDVDDVLGRKNTAPIVDKRFDEKKDYQYNPFMGKESECRKDCNAVCQMVGSDALVRDAVRLKNIVSAKKIVGRLFSVIVDGPILEIPKAVITKVVATGKTAITKIGRVLRPILVSARQRRSSNVGRLAGKCTCGNYFKILWMDRFSRVRACQCGRMAV